MRDLDGESVVCEAADGMDKLDMRQLEEDAQERVHQEADNACTYYHDCFDIIARHESEHGDAAMEFCGDQEFKADQYREAAQAYAYGIACGVLNASVSDALQRVQEAADALTSVCDATEDDLRVSRDCPHGWAPHAKEDEDGIHYWHKLEGELEAVAVNAGPFWLSYTWTPESEDEDEE